MVSQIQLGNLFSVNGRNVLSGSASGLDTSALIDNLVAAKQQPATDLKTKVDANTKQITAYGQLNTKLAALQDAANFLRNPTGVNNATNNVFAYRTASVSTNTGIAASSYLSVTVQPGATIQNYTIDKIVSTAQAKEQTTGTFVISDSNQSVVSATANGNPGDPTYEFGVGTLTFPNISGVGTTGVVLNDGDTLLAVANKFNAVKATTGISAQIIKTGDNAFQLLFTATRTGTDADFDLNSGLSVTDTSGVLDAIKGSGPTKITLVQDADNAKFDFNGVTITRQSNTVTDLVSNVTFNILQDTVTAPTTKLGVQISPDTATVQNAITNFANVYNDLRFFYTTQTARNSDGTAAEGATLIGSSTLGNLSDTVEAQLTRIVGGITGGDPSQLADLGIILQDFPGDGTNPAASNIININTDTLQKALQSNFAGVSNVFGFNFTSSSTNLQLFSDTNALAVNSFTLTIDPNTGTYQASFLDTDNNPKTIDLDAKVTATGITLSGKSGTELEGLVLLYSGSAVASIDVTATQGIADQVYNTAKATLDANTGTIQGAIKSLNDTNTRYQSDITNINDQIAVYKDQLINKFASLEAAITKVNTILTSLTAQEAARNSN